MRKILQTILLGGTILLSSFSLIATPTINQQPESQDVELGSDVTFNVLAAGTAPLHYQWQFNEANLAGATNASLTLQNVQEAQEGSYRVIVSDNDDLAISDNAELTTFYVPPLPQGISGDFSLTEQYGIFIDGTPHFGTATGTIHVDNGSFHRLNKTGLPLSDSIIGTGYINDDGTLQDHYAVVPAIVATSAGFYVVVKLSFTTVAINIGRHSGSNIDPGSFSTGGNIYSAMDGEGHGVHNGLVIDTYSHATLSRSGAAAPKIVLQPKKQDVVAGDAVFMSVSASGAGPLYYHWRRNSAFLYDDDHFTDTFGPTLVITGAQFADAGTYTVEVSNAKGKVVSSAAVLTVNSLPGIATNPVSLIATAGGRASFTVVANGTPPLSYQWLSNGFPIPAQRTATLPLSNLSLANAGSYSVIVSNKFGSIVSDDALLFVTPSAPTIANPAENFRSFNPQVSIKGGEAGNGGTTLILYDLNDGGWQNASTTNNWTNWLATVSLRAGTNTFRVKAINSFGESAETIRHIFFVVTNQLSLTVVSAGSGSVTPNLNGKWLEIGGPYKLVAAPMGNNVFSNWSGSVSSTNSTLNFLMQSNMVLYANFAPNPFPAVAGIYNGLFSVATGVTAETAGLVRNFTLTPKGTYSGTVLINGGTYTLSGGFDIYGHSSNFIARPLLNGGNLRLDIGVEWDGRFLEITGQVFGVSWAADLGMVANAKRTNSGVYTMLIPPDPGTAPASSPGGFGFASIINKASSLTISGTLGDGTTFNQSVPLNQAFTAPLFINLYGGKGLVYSVLNFDTNSLVGNTALTWIKKAIRSPVVYTNGFTNVVSILGAPWQKPAAKTTALPFTTNAPGTLEIHGRNGIDLTNQIVISSNNNAIIKLPNPNYSTNSLTGTIDPATGLMTVTFVNGRTTATAKGIAIQTPDNDPEITTNGGGYFPAGNQTGSILLKSR